MDTQDKQAKRGAPRRRKGSYLLNKHHGFWCGRRLSARYLRQRDKLTLPPTPAEAAHDYDHYDHYDHHDHHDYHEHHDDYEHRHERGLDRLDQAWFASERRLLDAVPFNPPRLVGPGPQRWKLPPRPRARAPRAKIELRVVDHLCALIEAGAPAQLTDPHTQAELAALQHLVDDPRSVSPHLAIALDLFEPLWIRSPASWDPTQTPSLVEHLLVEYPVPRFLLGAWRAPEKLDLRFMAWLITLGQGGSLRRLTQLAQARGCPGAWPAVAKKLPGLLARVPDKLPPVHGLMYAEVLRLGASGAEFRWLRANPSYVLDPTTVDAPSYEFWAGGVRWLARHREQLDDHSCERILAWAQHLHTERRRGPAPFDWAGRTLEAAAREALVYHQRYMRPRYYRPRIGLRWAHHGWDAKWEVDGATWSFTELITSDQLAEESRAMRHCVRGYDRYCAAERSAIFSLCRFRKRCLTVEVRLPSKRVVQVRGVCNRLPTTDEQAIVDRWAQTLLACGP